MLERAQASAGGGDEGVEARRPSKRPNATDTRTAYILTTGKVLLAKGGGAVHPAAVRLPGDRSIGKSSVIR